MFCKAEKHSLEYEEAARDEDTRASAYHRNGILGIENNRVREGVELLRQSYSLEPDAALRKQILRLERQYGLSADWLEPADH